MDMRRSIKVLLFLTVVGGLNATGANAALVGTAWTPGTNDPEPGTLGVSTVSLDTQTGATRDVGYLSDLNGGSPGYDALPLASDEVVYYAREDDWTSTFSAPVVGLYAYIYNWRPGTYTFDKSFTIIDSEAGVSSVGLVLTVGSGSSGRGILQFAGSTGSLGMTSVVTGEGGTLNLLTFAEDDTIQSSPAVPEPSTFALAGLGLVGLGFVALRKKYRRA